MKVLVSGSRDWTDRGVIYAALADLALLADLPGRPYITVIHGDARGADRLAAGIAVSLGYGVQAFPANWDKHGRRAGILRNYQMLHERPDRVLAFRLNRSRGTSHMIEIALEAGVPVDVFDDVAP